MKIAKTIIASLCCAWLVSCATGTGDSSNRNIERAGQTLDSLYKYYAVPGTGLLRENYPFTEDYTATYLASEEQALCPKEFAFLWPFSGTFSAVNALYEATGSDAYLGMLEDTVLPGLEEYHDITRTPFAYSSYINSAPESDRYYDDNVWLGIDFTDLYRMTGKREYLAKAEEIWNFIESGTDEQLGGGIYWCEQTRQSKNTCSNAPGAVYALKLYQATGKTKYLEQGRELYDWTARRLRDTGDDLYFDNISLEGKVNRRKFSYNSGQMIQAAALLYDITGDDVYLDDARSTAAASFEYFTREHASADGRPVRILTNDGNVWFSAVMVRGFCELYRIDRDRRYIDGIRRSLDHAWKTGRDSNGLFASDWIGGESSSEKWLLNQAAVVEMFARIGNMENV